MSLRLAASLLGLGACTMNQSLSKTQEMRPSTGHGYKSSEPWIPRQDIPGAVSAETFFAHEPLPSSFDWRDVNGRSYVTTDWNQHIPQYCGACWIHGTVHALNDRIKVMRGGKFPDVLLARQVIINCVPDPSGEGPPPGCNGGDARMIHKYLHENKVPDESCMPYQARNMECVPGNVCRNCFPGDKGCFTVDNWIGFGVSSYGHISGELAMMKEIYARGPIACSFAADDSFMTNFSANALSHEGVYVTDKEFNVSQIDHVMEVAGWGETPSGLKYWILRNSWGTYWGENGWLKLRRGTNQMLGESSCDWAVPTFEDLTGSLQGRSIGDYVHGIMAVEPAVVKTGVAQEIPFGASLAAAEHRPSVLRPRDHASGSGTRALFASHLAVFLFGGFAVAGFFIGSASRARSQRQAPLLG